MFTHTCKKCGLVVEYNHPDELKNHFYFKSGYFRNVCKNCEKEEHKIKYKDGKYNYRNGNKKDVIDQTHSFTLNDRSYN